MFSSLSKDVQTMINRFVHEYNLRECFQTMFTNMTWDDTDGWVSHAHLYRNQTGCSIYYLFTYRTQGCFYRYIYHIDIDNFKFSETDYEVPMCIRLDFNN